MSGVSVELGVVWAMFMSGCVSMRMHPGFDDGSELSLGECARISDLMLQLYKERFHAVDRSDDRCG